jgi:hypothetical protein
MWVIPWGRDGNEKNERESLPEMGDFLAISFLDFFV